MSLRGGPKAEPPAWARVRLTRGRSRQQVWDVDSGTEPTVLIAGSGSRADWRIQASGVAGAHLELLWDGSRLWLHPLDGTCSVDGIPVSDWRQLTGRTRVEIGDAALIADASESAEVSTSILAGATLRPGIRASDADEGRTTVAATRVAALAASLRPVPSEGPTVLDEGRARSAPPGPGAEDDGPTTKVRGGSRRGLDAKGSPHRTVRARRAVPERRAPASSEPGSAPRPAVVTDGTGGPASEGDPPDPPGTVRRGGSADAPGGASSRLAAVHVAQGEPKQPVPDEDATAFRPPGADLVDDGAPPPTPPPPPDPTEASRGRGRLRRALPPRTLALLGGGIAALVVVFFVLPRNEAPSIPRSPGESDTSAEAASASASRTEAHDDPTPEPDEPGRASAVKDEEEEAANEQEREAPEDGAAEVEQARAAVDHLFAGRRDKALEAYRALAAAEPQHRAYGEVVRILERQATGPCAGEGIEEARCER